MEDGAVVFSSPIFLFGFLPLVLSLYYLSPRSARNLLLLAMSALFYAWGEKLYVLVLSASLLVNYINARWIAWEQQQGRSGRWVLTLGIVFNLGLLLTFKYLGFVSDNVATAWHGLGGNPWQAPHLHLPIGISFFTFQAMSYGIDVFRRQVAVQRNFLDFGLYIFLFPQMVAGPIIRYRDVAEQLHSRSHSLDKFALGVQRFIRGLAKKVLLATPLAATADAIFDLPPSELAASAAWLGLVCYTLQIYFDFSGYSDMAIGIGKMLGFDFLENFRYPYVARSVTEFWRRWHISLSNWFRDYLYIPLGGNRHGPWHTYRNLLIVFLLCGLWHGASWAFLAWGLYHGLFLIFERLGLGTFLETQWKPTRHLYTLLVVMVGWVFFRCTYLMDALSYCSALAGGTAGWYQASAFWTWELAIVLPLAILAALPIRPWLENQRERLLARLPATHAQWVELGFALPALLLLLTMFWGATLRLTAGTYTPFIYFRF